MDNILSSEYIKENKPTYLLVIDIYPKGLWTLIFRKARIERFNLLDEFYFGGQYYSLSLKVPRFLGEAYDGEESGHTFSLKPNTIDNNKDIMIKLYNARVSYCNRFYYLCSSFKGALQVLNKDFINDKKYNEATIKKRQRIYKQFFSTWLKSKDKENFVVGTR
jgi:hypothetical protein